MIRTFTGRVTIDGTTRDFTIDAESEYTARLLVLDDLDPLADRDDADYTFTFDYPSA